MPDYNIYIHAVGGGASNANPTVPWGAREDGGGASGFPTTSQGGGASSGAGFDAARAITRAAGYAQNPDSIIGSAVSALAKISPYVLAAYAVVKLTITIIDNATEFNALESGDHRSVNAWQNVKTAVGHVFHPVSSWWISYKTEREWSRENSRLTQQRDLLGDSVINTFRGRGVQYAKSLY